MNSLSDYLYAKPSFIEGISRLVDFGSTLQEYNRSLSSEQADYLALLSDWKTTGNDIRGAIEEFKGTNIRLREELLAEACQALAEAKIVDR